MCEILSIGFFYDSSHTSDFVCMSTFFNFCGFMTAGYRLNGAAEEKDDAKDGCELNIYLDGDPAGMDSKKDIIMHLSGRKEQSEYALLLDLLKIMYDHAEVISENTFNQLSAICDLFQKYKLKIAEYNCQNYFPLENRVKDEYWKYYDANSEIMKILETQTFSDCPYYWYARGMFILRMHQLAEYGDLPKKYNIQAIVNQLESLHGQYPEFITIDELIGHLEMTRNELKHNAGAYYEKSYNSIKKGVSEGKFREGKYLGGLLYTIAKWYESVDDNKNKAMECYQLALEVNPTDIRSLYKVALYFRDMSRNVSNRIFCLQETYRYCTRIEELIQDIREDGYLQPREAEYEIKVCYIKWRMVNKGDIQGDEKALWERLHWALDQHAGSSRFYTKFYGEDAESYRKLVRNRFEELYRRAL